MILKSIYLLLGIALVAPFLIISPLSLNQDSIILFYACMLGAVFVLCILKVKKEKFRTRELTGLATMVALATLLQASPFWPVDPFTGVIRIDLAGVPWVLAFFLYGIAGALLVSVSCFFLTIPLSYGGGVIGAFSKFYATIPGFLVPYVLLVLMRKKMKALSEVKLALVALLSAVVFRGLFMCIFNYYFAGPLFFGMSTGDIIAFLPPVALFLINALIGAIDFGVAWLLAFRKRIAPIHELN